MLLCLSMTSCLITNDIRITRIEIMKPRVLSFPENSKTVALINSVSNKSGYEPLTYTEHFRYTNDDSEYHETINRKVDTTVKYMTLSNLCLDALAAELKKAGYFARVINYQDSLTNISLTNKELFNPEELFQETQSDLCIFLDQIDFEIDKFTNFDHATTGASLSWIFVTKTDTVFYTYLQRDTLTFSPADFSFNLAEISCAVFSRHLQKAAVCKISYRLSRNEKEKKIIKKLLL